MKRLRLPIDSSLPEIVGQVERNTITLLRAEPGAGKTTRVPPALLQAPFEFVFVLEPRRLATRMAATRVAAELKEQVGNTVGYQVRFERVGGDATRLWFLTEGVFTRRLLSGMALPPRSVVVLDEFHERHLETDLALALLRVQLRSRPDLRVLIMSATLGEDLQSQLPEAPLIEVAGREFPVAVSYTPASARPLAELAAAAVGKALSATTGHTLVFLPGAAEIRETMAACGSLAHAAGVQLLALHGDLSPSEQDAAVAPSSRRKIICSTNIAESSVTTDGVEAVIDSGLARILTHSPWSGFSRLQVKRISQASAVQRAGRAGRTKPGIAVRLYSEEDFVRRPEATAPEVTRTDWTEPYLRLAAAGYDPNALPWLDGPPKQSLHSAVDLLTRLRALDESGAVTRLGRQMAALPVHPRIAVLPLLSPETSHLGAWLAEESGRLPRGSHFSSGVDAVCAAELTYAGRRTEAILRGAPREESFSAEKALLCAFPDRVAVRRGELLLLSNGSSARLHRESLAHNADCMVALEVEDRSDQATAVVRLASPIEPDWLLDLFPERIEANEVLRWNRQAQRAEQANQLRYDRVVIDESISEPADLEAATAMLVEKALEAGPSRFDESPSTSRFLARFRFAAEYATDWPTQDELVRLAFGQLASGMTSFADLEQAARGGGLQAAMEAQLDMHKLQTLAPAFIYLPSGRRAPIEYGEGRPPTVSSRLQDFFGLRQSLTVAAGAVPLTVKLLAPNGRPVQITTDLLSFWKDLYPQVRRELSRRYPRHPWPEAPG